MNDGSPLSVDRDDRLAEVLDAYLAAQEGGTPPDVDELLARYPDLAGDLRECLASLAFIHRAGNLSVAGDTPAEGEAAGGVLGDFRILREVGRGGMGVVYEAEQISLRRRVALKVLPFAATMDPRHLQRFHNEAQAAACLHHTNIVPVFFVGCERGVHFYAMQFIDGQPLSDLIRQLRGQEKTVSRPVGEARTAAYQPAPDAATPSPAAEMTPLTGEGRRGRDYYRKVAELGVQAAEALDHAHQLGIVHRDIKPANLLVDGRGNLWVTDFGLAHVQHTEASLTVTGQAVGTPRYMSPEQALAKREPIDHRTDVYSLGATLYELLTLRPVFESEDRQELLQQIAFEEPARPRRQNKVIPTELETIVLKAMEKRPQDRYATAKELADDLEHWLRDEPIQARRPPLRARLGRWGRRHRRLVWATALFLLLTVVGLAVSILLIWREKEQTKAALAQARTNYTQAEIQRRRAEANFREAFWAVEDLLCAFDPPRSKQPVTVEELRQWQTKVALEFLAPFCEDDSEDPAVRLQKGAAYVHTGRVYQILGERDKAQEAFLQAVVVFDRLARDFPDDPTFLHELATVFCILSEDRYQAGRFSNANVYAGQAASVWREVIRKHPDDVHTHVKLADLLCCWFDPQLRDPQAAVALARRAVELAPDDPHSWMVLGLAYYRADQWEASREALQKALLAPEVPRKWGWTHALFVLAMVQERCGRREEAMQAYQQAVQRMEKSFRTRDDQDRALGDEAATVLGIADAPKPKAKEGSPGKD